MGRKRRCPNFAWRDEDPAYLAERENDRVVFRKIKYEQARGRKVTAVIRTLFLSELWAPRLNGKNAESWRRMRRRREMTPRQRALFEEGMDLLRRGMPIEAIEARIGKEAAR